VFEYRFCGVQVIGIAVVEGYHYGAAWYTACSVGLQQMLKRHRMRVRAKHGQVFGKVVGPHTQ
jgi:hypothetical protein